MMNRRVGKGGRSWTARRQWSDARGRLWRPAGGAGVQRDAQKIKLVVERSVSAVDDGSLRALATTCCRHGKHVVSGGGTH